MTVTNTQLPHNGTFKKNVIKTKRPLVIEHDAEETCSFDVASNLAVGMDALVFLVDAF